MANPPNKAKGQKLSEEFGIKGSGLQMTQAQQKVTALKEFISYIEYHITGDTVPKEMQKSEWDSFIKKYSKWQPILTNSLKFLLQNRFEIKWITR